MALDAQSNVCTGPILYTNDPGQSISSHLNWRKSTFGTLHCTPETKEPMLTILTVER